MHLSVIIPSYNEEKRLPKTLREIDKYLRTQDYEYEIIVVNDGSKDKTAEIVKELMSQIKNLKLIDNKINQGKGAVVRQGLFEAKGDYRVFTDADNSTSIDQVERMWPEFSASAKGYGGPAEASGEAGEKGFDIVIGSRDIKGAVLDPAQDIKRRFLGETFKLIRKIIVGLWEIEDSQCGFKGFSAKAVQKIMPKCKINRWAFDPEILIIAKKIGFKIKEVPVRWVNDPESRVQFKGMLLMLGDLLKIRWSLISGKYD